MKKLLATLMALAMTLTLCTVAFATVVQENVAEVDGTGYTGFAAAVAAVKNGGTITLLKSCEADRVNLEDKSFTVVLNGNTLTSTAAYKVMFCAKNGNKITIDGTKEGSKLVGTLMVTSDTDGHIEINGGTYENPAYCPIYINGAVSTDNSTLTARNAIIKCTSTDSDQDAGWAMYLAGYCTSELTNCIVSAPITAIEIRAGKLTLNDCTVTGGDGTIETAPNGNGATVKNAAIAVAQHNTKKPIGVIINGGEYKATAAVYQIDVQPTGDDAQELVSTTINSGVFSGSVSKVNDHDKSKLSVSGGTFSTPVRSYVVPTLKYEASDENGENYTYHGTLDEAVAAAGDTGYVDNISVNSNLGTFIVKYNDGTGRKIRIYTSLAAPEVPTMTREGYTFKGWLIDDGTTVYADLSNVEFSGDGATLTAVWEKIPARYYYNSTTTTTKDNTKSSPKTFDAGVGIYALTAVLSVTGMACVGKKKF